MMNPYHILYSLFYSLSQKMNGVNNAPIYHACLGLSVIILLNMVTLILIIDVIYKNGIFFKIADVSMHDFVFYNCIFFCINYIYFKVRKISSAERLYLFGRYVKASSLAATYAFVSVLLFSVMMFVWFNSNH